jgi:D-threo-aldose 1-dehydrogenase
MGSASKSTRPAPFVERATIGRAAVRVSALGFGCAPIGNLYTEVAEEQAQAALQEALERGVRYFDTAPFYGHGLSEHRLGRALASRPRTSFVVSTKSGRTIEPDTRERSVITDGFAVSGSRALFDYSRDGVQRSFDSSLRRLGLDYIDILLLHDVGSKTHGDRHEAVLKQALDEALPAMARLRDDGAIRAIGVGVNEQAVCLELMPNFDLDCIMLAGRYSLLEQHDSAELMAQAQQRGVKILAAGPYSSGLLASPTGPGATYNYLPVDSTTLERARQLYSACLQEGVNVGAAALQFPLAHPAVVSVVAGLRSAEEVVSAFDRLSAQIPPALWMQLKQSGLIDPGSSVPTA